MTIANQNRNQLNLLDYGWVRDQSNDVWEKTGGIARFVGADGECGYGQFNNWGSYNYDVFEDDGDRFDNNSDTWTTQPVPTVKLFETGDINDE